jgi:ribonuclease E
MSKNDSPAGSTGGSVALPDLDALPEKMRVHALAKLIGVTSREVLAALSGLGHEARTAQSSIERKVVEQVIGALVPGVADGTPDGSGASAGAAGSGGAVGSTGAAGSAGAVDGAGGAAGSAAAAGSGDASAAAEAPASGRRSRGRGRATRSGAAERAADPAADSAAADSGAAADAGLAPEPIGALAPVFAPPTPLFQPPARPEAVAEEAPVEAPPSRRRRRGGGKAVEEPVAAEDTTAEVAADIAVEETADADTADDLDDGSDDSDDSARRRRRRGRRGRGRGRGGDETDENENDAESDTDDESEDDAEESDDTDGESSESSRRRRRRRRRRGSGDDAADSPDDDPPGTVTRIRAPREPRSDNGDSGDGDGVQSVRGSTRLEAKRQRRRDGRDAGRRRQPILSEAEFLARRESVERTMVVRERGSRVEIGVLEDDVLVEHFVTGRDGDSLVGNVYLGRVQNVLPSMEAAFVDIGRGRNAVLYAGEVDWDAAGLGGKARRIEQALSTGDSVLVQVTKDPIGHKGARLTTQISLAGRFLVYVPSGGAAGISRKLPDVERRRLKDMLRDIVPSEAGVIIRTASEGVSQEALERDVRRLQVQWEVVKTKSEQTGPGRPKAPALLYEEPDLLIKVVRDQFNEDFSRLVIQGDDAWDTLHGYLAHVAPELADRMHRHVGNQDVFSTHRIDEQLLKALDRKVWLPSGGTLVIDRTEAMTVIDVNTGKFTGSGGNLEETVTRNNLEAAEEVVRQLRLRDVGGIIVIDFIDMVLEANRDLVLRRLTECLARDRTRHQVAEVTSLGLVQMTRKRVGGGLLEHFSTPCEHCRGRGVVVDTEAIEHAEPSKPEAGGGGRKSRGGRGRRGDGETNGHNGNGRSVNGSGGSDAGSTGDHAAVVAATAVIAAAGNRSGGAVATADAAPVGDAAVTDGAITEVAADVAAEVAVDVAAEVVAQVAETSALAADARAADAAPATAAPATAAAAAAAPAAAAAAPATDAQAAGAAPVGAAPGAVVPVVDAPTADPVEAAPAESPGPRRRRGRVTRTAGAPTVTEGEAPAAAVVTVAGPAESDTAPSTGSAAPPAEVAAPAVAPQPEPTAASRPRRARRAASRPAGPPAEVPAESAGGDPV